jgi:hypothetical protein
MSGVISTLLGAIVGGLAAIAGAALQVRSAARLRREEVARQEKERRRLLARRYLYQFEDAVDSLLHRVDNWSRRAGHEFTEAVHPGYWEITSLYILARALGAEHILDLEGVYVELQALSSSECAKLQQLSVEGAVREALGQAFFLYHRRALAEAVLDWTGDEFRLLIYSEFLRRYENPAWNSLLEPARRALGSLRKEKFEELERSLTSLHASLSKCIKELTSLASPVN